MARSLLGATEKMISEETTWRLPLEIHAMHAEGWGGDGLAP